MEKKKEKLMEKERYFMASTVIGSSTVMGTSPSFSQNFFPAHRLTGSHASNPSQQ